MTFNYGVKPEDVLADGVDTTHINGKTIRKGTVAAFLANIEIMEDGNASEQIRQGATNMIKELAPAIVTLGLHKHVLFRNPQIEQILLDEVLQKNP